jgi:hypothetical protein
VRSSAPRSTQVALAYVILGLGYVGMLAVLLNALWAGSLTRLWQDISAFPSSVLPLAVGLLVNFVAAAIIYRYERHSRNVRWLGMLVAVALFVVSSIGAIQVFRLWQRGPLPEGVPPEAVWVRPIGALIYGWLGFEVMRLLRASNNRWRGP